MKMNTVTVNHHWRVSRGKHMDKARFMKNAEWKRFSRYSLFQERWKTDAAGVCYPQTPLCWWQQQSRNASHRSLKRETARKRRRACDRQLHDWRRMAGESAAWESVSALPERCYCDKWCYEI